MSCVFLSKSIPRSLPHSFLNKLADEFQSSKLVVEGLRGGGGGGGVGGGGVWVGVDQNLLEVEGPENGAGRGARGVSNISSGNSLSPSPPPPHPPPPYIFFPLLPVQA